MAKAKCSKCGTELEKNITICPNCGTKKERKKKKNEIDEKENLEKISNEYLEKKIAVINVKTAAKEGYRDYAENINKPNKKKIIHDNNVFYIIITILLIIIFILSLMLINTRNNKCINQKDDNADKFNEIKIYNSRNGFITEKTSKSEYIGTIKTTDINIHIYDGIILYSESDKIDGLVLLYKDDDKIKIYNTKLEVETILDLKNNYDEYHLVYDQETKKIEGISFLDGVQKEYDTYLEIEYSGYYDLNLKKEIYVGKGYYDFTYINSNKIKAKKGFSNNLYLNLLDLKEEKILLSDKYDNTNCGSIDYIGLTANYIISGKPGCMGKYMTEATIYDENMNVVIENIEQSNIEIYLNNLYVSKNNKIYRFTNGNEKYESNEFEKVIDIINDHFIIVENGNIVITNERNKKIIVAPWNDNLNYQQILSGYKNELELNDNEKEEGIYIVFQKGEYNEYIEYFYNPIDNSIKEYIHNDLTI